MAHQTLEPDQLRQAFNDGSDARLAGRPQSENPYQVKHKLLAISWLRGWKDVDLNWARADKWRRAAKLPEVVA